MPASTDRFDPAQNAWMRTEGLRRVMEAIRAGGGEARFVGGCVRDALAGRKVGDIDLAVNLQPQKVAEILAKAGIKVVPTGIDHGTVTAVADNKGYEITTLRHDVETDGRHAKVAFTDDWQADAARRDFTFNALYADADGKIYDYFDGRADLAAAHVRFIGDARARIKEDVLRILRFFRFYAAFGKGAPDADGLNACRELADLIPQLSIERVWREIVKLLATENPSPSWALMKQSGVLKFVLPDADNLQHLDALLAVEKKFEVAPNAMLRLAALLPEGEGTALRIAQQMKLSNREADRLQALAVLPGRLRGRLDPVPFRRVMYEFGAEPARDGVLLLAATLPGVDPEPALAEAAVWEKQVFPLQGNDILKLGIAPGPQVGALLREVEEWWIDQDFRATRAQCLAEAEQKVRRRS